MEQQSEETTLLGILGQLKKYDGELNKHGTIETWKPSKFTQEDISAPPHILMNRDQRLIKWIPVCCS